MGKHWKNMLGLKEKEKPEPKPITVLTAQKNSVDIIKPRDRKEPQIQIITAGKKKKEPKQGAVYPTRMGGGIFSPYPGATQNPLMPPASPGINQAEAEQKSLIGPSPPPSVNLSIVSGSTAAATQPASNTPVGSQITTNNPSSTPQATTNLTDSPPTRSSSTSSHNTVFTSAVKRNSTTIQPVPDCDDPLRRAPSSGPAGDPTIVLPPIEDKEPPEPTVSIIDDEGDLLLECVPDDYDESDTKSPEVRAFKVCSHILRRTSPVFKRMFSPNSGFLESEVCELDGLRHASVTCHADSMEIMLNIVHYRRDKIPKEMELSADQLRNLAIFSDQYDVPDASASHVESWVNRWTGATSDFGNRAINELSSLLLVAYVFKLEKLFEVVTRDLAVRCVWRSGKVYHCWDLSKDEGKEIELSDLLPPKLQEAIHSLHTQTGRDIMDDSVLMMSEYLKAEAEMRAEDYITPYYALATYPYEMKERLLADASFYFVLTKFLKRSGLTADGIIKKSNDTTKNITTSENANPSRFGRRNRNAINPSAAIATNNPSNTTTNNTSTATAIVPAPVGTVGAIETCATENDKVEEKEDDIEPLDLPVSLKFIFDESTQIDNLLNKSEVRRDHISRARFCREWASKVTTHLDKLKGLQLKDFVRN